MRCVAVSIGNKLHVHIFATREESPMQSLQRLGQLVEPVLGATSGATRGANLVEQLVDPILGATSGATSGASTRSHLWSH